MNSYIAGHNIKIDHVYKDASHPENIFERALYHKDSQFWLHKDLAEIVVLAAKIFKGMDYTLVLKDGLRPLEAQALMLETEIVQKNLHWLEEPRLLSPPGKGGHPRGMAVDVLLQDSLGQDLDFGTVFDFLTHDPSNNPAARNYKNLPEDVIQNREILENGMLEAAKLTGKDLLPLPTEWWDFRFMPDFINQYQPLSTKDLPFEH
tara:strand:+ start:375 stop:989 length:615 start_codon:yes stop_codon:yes gene_type:complete